MKTLFAIAMLAFSFSAVAGSTAPISSSHPAPSNPDSWMGAQPDVRVRVKSIRDTDTYLVSAVITDTRDGRVLSGPTMTVKAGVPAKVEVGTTGAPDATSLMFSVTVAPDGKTASYRSEVRSNAVVVSAQDAVLAVTP